MKRSPLKTHRRRRTMMPNEIDAQRVRLWRKQGGLCPVCRGRLSDCAYPRPQVAHVIPDTLVNRKAFGDAVIDHDVNKQLVCSLRCNNAAQLQPGARPVEVAQHVERIRAAVKDE